MLVFAPYKIREFLEVGFFKFSRKVLLPRGMDFYRFFGVHIVIVRILYT